MRVKNYGCLTKSNNEDKKAKERHKKVCQKQKQLKTKDYKSSLKVTELQNKISQLE